MAVCMKVIAGHIHDAACDKAAREKHVGPRGPYETTQIGLRIPDADAVKLRELAARYDSVNAYLRHLINSQALRER